MKKINSDQIYDAIYEGFSEVNTRINPDIKNKLKDLYDNEVSPNAKEALNTMLRNFEIADCEDLPICQDTGMAVVFVEIGQEVFIEGEYLEDTINRAVEDVYRDKYFRKSVVGDPLDRVNTKTNTPAIIHTKIVPGDQIKFTMTAKGFGSENTSALKMLKPSDGIEGVLDFINETVEKAIPNGCAPLVVGVGIGGDFEQVALNAKRALLEPVLNTSTNPFYAELEKQILENANNTGIGPMGLGGINSVLAVHIKEAPTHIAGLPVAVNICCYVDRVIEKII